MKLLTIPNILSLSRLPLAAAFLAFDNRTARIIIVCVVALTDLLDGYLARRIPSHDKRAGALLDPITDKLFVLTALLTFAVQKELSVPLLLLLLIRDFYTALMFAYLKLRGSRVSFRSRLSGKTATVLQLAVLFALLFKPVLARPLIWVTTAASLVAIVDYTLAGIREQRLAANAAAP